jgi:hypothetical protein
MSLLQRIRNFFRRRPGKLLQEPEFRYRNVPSRVKVQWPYLATVVEPCLGSWVLSVSRCDVDTREIRNAILPGDEGSITSVESKFFVVQLDRRPGIYLAIPHHIVDVIATKSVPV